MSQATTDLCDAHGDAVRVVARLFHDFGRRRRFAGSITSVKVHEDNALVRATLEQAGSWLPILRSGNERGPGVCA